MMNNSVIRIKFLNDKYDLKQEIEKIKREVQKNLGNSNNSIIFNEGKEEFTDIDNQLKAYLNGKLTKFDISFTLLNISPFNVKVLEETSKIPSGNVKTYKEIAAKIDNPNSYRAVGNALASNPIPIIIPCHRVVKSNGSVGGFGGSPQLKKKLLMLEGVFHIKE